jgi:hypothetical protein
VSKSARLVLPARICSLCFVKSCASLAACKSSVVVLMDWVLLRAVRLAAVVCELACLTCAAPPTVAERHVPKGPGPAVLSKRFG